MRDGFWINYEINHFEPIKEHETCLRRWDVATRLRVPKKIFTQFQHYTPIVDREAFLLFVYRNVPLMRVRAHGTYTRFEFSSEDEKAAYKAIKRFADKHLGEAMMLSIANFISGREKTVNVFPVQLRQLMGRNKVSNPEVGIFWIDATDGTMFADSVQLQDAVDYDECKTLDRAHMDVWDRAVRANPKWRGREYEEVPRGRVVYKKDPTPEFIVYMPPQIAKHKNKVLRRFNIPKGSARFDFSDNHYRTGYEAP